MALLRSAEFFTGQVHGAGPITLYTVPAGHLAVVRSVIVQNEANTTNFVTIDVNGVYNLFTINLREIGVTDSMKTWEGRLAMAAGSTLRYYSASTTKVTDVHAMGYIYFV